MKVKIDTQATPSSPHPYPPGRPYQYVYVIHEQWTSGNEPRLAWYDNHTEVYGEILVKRD